MWIVGENILYRSSKFFMNLESPSSTKVKQQWEKNAETPFELAERVSVPCNWKSIEIVILSE